ncbi:MAG: hypothetical protein E7158_06290 [Firmicutes bacterium]|nr:hypothetical protein [Bacillota bacterium]
MKIKKKNSYNKVFEKRKKEHHRNKTYVDGIGMVDLTEAFGAGNEPTQQWCDENIEYFDGSTTIYKD